MNTKKKYRDKLNINAVTSVTQKLMLDKHMWTLWFKDKTSNRNRNYVLTEIEAFDLMIKDCYYCGDIALSIDRLDSDREHTLDNCVGCCVACNSSKGAIDPKTFVLQAVYRTTFEYPESNDIWCERKRKSQISLYKFNAKRQNKKFELTKEQFEKFINGICAYCRRTPKSGSYFGIDKIDPNEGYTNENCVTACTSCNWAKWDQSVDDFIARDKRITDRYLTGCFDDIPHVEKNTSLRRLNTGKSSVSGADHHNSKKVYQYDKYGKCIGVFCSVTEAAESIDGHCASISRCAHRKGKYAGNFMWSYDPPGVVSTKS
jgi:5-methylcytosine-specific restriction endonuclease McrA